MYPSAYKAIIAYKEFIMLEFATFNDELLFFCDGLVLWGIQI